MNKWFAKSTAAIPALNVWELVIMALIFVVGLRGLLGAAGTVAFIAIGPVGAMIWYITLMVFSVMYVAGQFMMPPNGLVVSIFAGMAISIGSICVYAGLVTVMGTFFFTGFASLLIFAFGSLARTIQMFRQMSKLQKITSAIGKEGYGVNRDGTNFRTN